MNRPKSIEKVIMELGLMNDVHSKRSKILKMVPSPLSKEEKTSCHNSVLFSLFEDKYRIFIFKFH